MEEVLLGKSPQTVRTLDEAAELVLKVSRVDTRRAESLNRVDLRRAILVFRDDEENRYSHSFLSALSGKTFSKVRALSPRLAHSFALDILDEYADSLRADEYEHGWVVIGVHRVRWERLVQVDTFLQEFVDVVMHDPKEKQVYRKVTEMARNYHFGFKTPGAVIAKYIEHLSQAGYSKWERVARQILDEKFSRSEQTWRVTFRTQAELDELILQVRQGKVDRGTHYQDLLMSYPLESI